jgi:hypothetical protein
VSLFPASAAIWGALGAFIYGAPRLIACAIACRDAGTSSWLCVLEFGVALLIGTIAAAAFSALVLSLTHLKDGHAISAMIGLLANPTAPKVVSRVSDIMGGVIGAILGKPFGEK